MKLEREVRIAEAKDLPDVLSLLAVMHDEEPPASWGESEEALFEQILADDLRRLLVAIDGGRVVGTCDVKVVPNLSRCGRPWAIVENLSVAPESRRRGWASTLIKSAIAFAEDRGCYKIQLVSNRRRSEAHSLYGKLGFTAPVSGFRMYLDESLAAGGE